MQSSEFLRLQAARCLRIAAAVDDQSVVAALVVMADDFSVKADEIEPHAEPPPRQAAVAEAAAAASQPERV